MRLRNPAHFINLATNVKSKTLMFSNSLYYIASPELTVIMNYKGITPVWFIQVANSTVALPAHADEDEAHSGHHSCHH